eukprot:TRINITY_DN76849_c0_g1_i1.p1 TRINITY_DN76849_c0_g1~~TRINITY_DN76849_c0_g1_i1.p1  ORF type:complete len:464 (-),score=64.82 TRINITY_DN76849_c0_g1_i1:51-1418(-)
MEIASAVLLVLAHAVLTAAALVTAYSLWKCLHLKIFLKPFKKIPIPTLSFCLPGWKKNSCSRDEQGEAAQAIDKAKKHQLCTVVVRPISAIGGVMLTISLCRYHLSDLDGAELLRAMPALPFYLVLALTGAVLQARPEFLSFGRLVFAFFLQFTCLVHSLVVSPDYLTLQIRRLNLTTLRVSHGAILMHTPCIIVENLIASVCTILLSIKMSQEQDVSDRNNLLNDLIQELWVTSAACCIQLLVARSLKSESVAIVETKAAQQTATTCRGLLSRMCDAVVCLGPDLHLQEASQHLASLLLKNAAPGYFRGQRFADLVVAEDQERVENELLVNSVNTFNSCMLDSSMNKVEVQIYHVPFFDMEDKLCHLLGICERSKEEMCKMHSAMPSAMWRQAPRDMLELEDGQHLRWRGYAQEDSPVDDGGSGSITSGDLDRDQHFRAVLTIQAATFEVQRSP